MKIVCLDGFTLNPGDISWAPFEALGELVVHERTHPAQVVERAAGASIVLTNKTPLGADDLTKLNELKYIGVLATGYNVIDVKAASARDIVVTNIPSYGTASVAEHVLALLLQMVRPIELHHRAVQAGQWSRSPDWCFSLSPISTLANRTLGIVGVGRIGLAVATIASALEMRLVGHDVFWPDPKRLGSLSIERLELDALFERSDVITLHCPLTPASKHLVDARRLALVKRSAVLINTSRGPLIDEHALADALRDNRLGGAALDVLDQEPPPDNHPLIGLENCVVTPHIAWYAADARQRLMDIAAQNLSAFLNGRADNKVN